MRRELTLTFPVSRRRGGDACHSAFGAVLDMQLHFISNSLLVVTFDFSRFCQHNSMVKKFLNSKMPRISDCVSYSV